ncbi:DUF2971 domain-containing protein [Rhizobium ruizarguesonis]|uniref:DUF2971 domain-containing protein n=1 Tax=Rhizobium ruizarguesonis TaxID=2081791 RepID=UPI001030874D|nr:DUF2971 domain-containing protein [Rhizobium ruizarguesonis]TBA26007.1 DUF2971 domain-containing protein [Rhizobium ruizarguesonis]
MWPTASEQSLLAATFFQTFNDELEKIRTARNRFVHYTSAETAYKIIENKEIWLRNAAVMNDFSEISYGIDCLSAARAGPAGIAFTNALNSIDPSIVTTVDDLFQKWQPYFQNDTFLASFAVHENDEDEIGRLSMWRAYGNVAIVLKGDVFTNPGPVPISGVTASPVAYFTAKEAESALWRMAAAIAANAGQLRLMKREFIVNSLHSALRFSILANKHPGFREEREWRIMHSPSHDPSPMQRLPVTIAGVPQQICKFKFPGQFGDKQFVEAIDRVIIGPAQHANVMRAAFQNLLASNGVSDALNRVAVSNIPLRQ